MSDNKVTLDQLDNSAVEAMSSSVGDVNMLNTENKTIVGAITEIVGKKEIANAIGEPLAETDKFTEMSSEINGLLSTFKTNMMNAGVVVESGDKFKALIDKIATMSGGGLDIISATELPATGKENQICVITDNPVNSFITTSYAGDIDDSSSDIIVKLGAGTGPISNKLEIGVDNRSIYRVDAIYQSGNILPSYLYTGGEWVDFTKAGFIIIQNRKYADGITLNGGTMTEGYGLYLKTGNMSASTTTSSSIGYTELLDFSNFTKCVIVGEHSYASVAKYIQMNIADSNGNSLGTIFGDSASAVPLNFTETFNLSEYTGTYKFSILVKFNNDSAYTATGEIWIYDIIFM
jgi:hypothetical protein